MSMPKQVPTAVPPSTGRLFAAFLRLGLTAFGGPSMVEYIRDLAVKKNPWLDDDIFQSGVALCQTIPGATAMQTAAYVGYRLHGILGAASCFIGFGLPAFALMMVLSAVYLNIKELPLAVSLFEGLRPIVVAIIANAAFKFGLSSLKTVRQGAIAVASALLFFLGLNPIFVIAIAAALGMLLLHFTGNESGATRTHRPQDSSSRAIFLSLIAVFVAFLMLFVVNRGLFDLAALMFRIDLFAFGGGFASVPLMYHEVVKVRQWIPGQSFMDGIALGQITPGPIVITATFIGYLLEGPLGAVVATIAIFTPSFILLVCSIPWFDHLRLSPWFNCAMSGILCSFVGLLLTVAIRFAFALHWDFKAVLLGLAAFAALMMSIDILWVVLVGIAASLLIPFILPLFGPA
jgi:chromate transporter